MNFNLTKFPFFKSVSNNIIAGKCNDLPFDPIDETKKYYILDTNVLLTDPKSIFKFKDNNVVLCEIVLEELDNHKNGNTLINYSSREVVRYIRELMDAFKDTHNISTTGLPILNDDCKGRLLVESNHNKDYMTPDNIILDTAKHLKNSGKTVIVVSNDSLVLVKAASMNIKCEEYRTDRIKDNELEEYNNTYYTYKKTIDSIYAMDTIEIELSEIDTLFDEDNNVLSREEFLQEAHPNKYIILKAIDNPNSSITCKFNNNMDSLLYVPSSMPYSLKSRNANQLFFIDACLQSPKDIPLVIAIGPAGTAKTLISLACGLESLQDCDNRYKKILICRPTIEMGSSIGYLPGTEKEKIEPYMRPIRDNIEVLLDYNSKDKYNSKDMDGKIDYFFDKGMIDVQSIGFLRGRSISNQYIIIDEAQNLTYNEITTIITRTSEDSKIIFIGDLNQIDHPYLDKRNSGLALLASKMKHSKLCSTIMFTNDDCQRSKLAEEANKFL